MFFLKVSMVCLTIYGGIVLRGFKTFLNFTILHNMANKPSPKIVYCPHQIKSAVRTYYLNLF